MLVVVAATLEVLVEGHPCGLAESGGGQLLDEGPRLRPGLPAGDLGGLLVAKLLGLAAKSDYGDLGSQLAAERVDAAG